MTHHPNRPSPTALVTLRGAVDLAAPRVEDIYIEELALALSHESRFGGFTSRFYSVAEHALFVSELVQESHPDRPDLVEAALHHDDYKAFTKDLTDPVRVMLGGAYEALVRRLNVAIADAVGFDVALLEHPVVVGANDRAGVIEAAHLCQDPAWDWTRADGDAPTHPAFLGGLPSETVRIEWLGRANGLRALDINPLVS
jgi:hypothetical protein